MTYGILPDFGTSRVFEDPSFIVIKNAIPLLSIVVQPLKIVITDLHNVVSMAFTGSSKMFSTNSK